MIVKILLWFGIIYFTLLFIRVVNSVILKGQPLNTVVEKIEKDALFYTD